MKTLTLSLSAALALAVGAGHAIAAPRQGALRTVPIVMHDPGCHWFLIGGKITTTASVNGPIRLKDLDENTLKIASRAGLRYVHVGNSTVLGRGSYVVMMVGQAVDDNYLQLTVR